MRLYKTIGFQALLIGMSIVTNAQNVWTGTTIPTTTTGQVGIGLTAPGAQLDIVNPAGTYPVGLKIKRNTSISAFNNIVEIWNYTNSLDFWIDGGGYAGFKTLATGGADKMVVAGSDGLLSTQAIPTGDNMGNGNATTSLFMNANNVNGIGNGGLNFAAGPNIAIDNNNNALTLASANTFPVFIKGPGLSVLQGTVVAQGFHSLSDKNLKKDIVMLSDEPDALMNLKTYKFNYKDSKFDNKLHFGMMAQEVQEMYPDLVMWQDGYLSVNYVEFIPLLITQAQQQNAKIKELESKMAALEALIKTMPLSSDNGTVNHAIEALKGSTLYQNTPNPFSRETTIRYNITGQFDNAFIGIYDLNGKQVKRITVQEANSQIVVPANMLSPGTYIYSLVVEGQLIDSKKMVVID